jgi:hypothetical protein
MNKTWTVELEEDPETGDLILPLNDEILEGTGLEIGDTVEWNDLGNGSWCMTKKEKETKYTLVECVSTFRMRYVVEVPVGTDDWAGDTVVMNEAKEFSQEHIGEQIISQRDISYKELIELCDIDNHYCKSWSDEQKIDAFVTQRKDYE